MNNEYSSKIQCILEEGKKCKKKLSFIGPTGPTGPAGPSTISIGNIITTEAGTRASVTNTGTNQNVVLSFLIPKGDKGDIGPTGPKGEKWDAGPTGPSGTGILAYATKYDTVGNDIELTENVLTTIPLNSTGPTLNIDNATANMLVINETGVYKIDYYFQGSANTNSTVILEVVQNTNPISSSSISKEFETDVDNGMNGSIIVSLTSNDKIGLGLDSRESITMTPTTGVNAYLNIVKL